MEKVREINKEKACGKMRACKVIEILKEETEGNAVVVPDVGQNQMWIAQYYKFNLPLPIYFLLIIVAQI